MAAQQYYNPTEDVHLKPMHIVASTASVHSAYSNGTYDPLPYGAAQTGEAIKVEMEDQKLKRWIRVLKFLSRAVAVILSLATLVPLAMTIVKFEQTKNVYFDVDGQQRTAWAHDTTTWYTFMYAAVAGVSFLLNLIVLAAYARGVKHANKAADISSWWTWLVLLVHVVVWIVSAVLYRIGKIPVNGKFKDLWGWTCSTAAKELQDVLTSVDFDKYCGIQTASFYIGLVNVGTGLLSVTILILAFMRRRSKKMVRRVTFQRGDLEPLRQ